MEIVVLAQMDPSLQWSYTDQLIRGVYNALFAEFSSV